MFEGNFFDELAKKLSDALPSNLKHVQKDLEKNFRAILQSTFNKLDLVTRDEFDAQSKVLARTRTKLEAIEKKLALLEAQLLSGKNKTTAKKKPS